MIIRTFSLDFAVQGGVVHPLDTHLHKLAVEFADQELQDKINLSDFRKVLVTCEIDENDVPVRVLGISCGQLVFDWPVMRFVDPEAAESLFSRMRSYLEDQGLRGAGTLIHVADREPKESRCPQWREWLRKMRASKASRWQVKV